MGIVQTQAQEIAALSAKIEALTDAVRMLCVQQGAHLNKQQLADRLGVHRNTITNMLERGRRMPRPGKWGQIGGPQFSQPSATESVLLQILQRGRILGYCVS